MQGLANSRQIRFRERLRQRVRRELRPAAAVPGNPELVYDLRQGGSAAGGFYAEAAHFSGRLLAEIESRAAQALTEYSLFVQDVLKEAQRSRGECGVELLTLGMTLSRYAGAAENSPAWVVKTCRALFRLRRRAPVKPLVDFTRAALTRAFLLPKIGVPAGEDAHSLRRLPRLIEWLEATGEFEQEVARIRNWRGLLETLPQVEAESWIAVAIGLFTWFEHEAAAALGGYTKGVSRFIEEEYARRGCREDQFFCSRPAVEYHLGMVTAEIMNGGLQAGFERKAKKVVLVPACMRGAKANVCRARVAGTDITCTSCDPECAVNRITQKMKALGVKVYIVPHATGFSRWLTRWQREPDTGVTAVACLLNILPGGYEMRARNIASQCVLLDYPGCAKHWREQAIPTAVNEQRLVQIVTAQARAGA